MSISQGETETFQSGTIQCPPSEMRASCPLRSWKGGMLGPGFGLSPTNFGESKRRFVKPKVKKGGMVHGSHREVVPAKTCVWRFGGGSSWFVV